MAKLQLTKLNFVLLVIILTGLCFGDVKLTESNFTLLFDWSYDGSKILFVTSKNNNFFNLATISPDGTNEKQVTTEEGAEFGAFHPDGSIYYWWEDGTGIKLMKMNSDGSGKTTLLTIPGGYSVWYWSGSTVTAKVGYILYNNSTGEETLWVVNLDGTGNTQLTNAYPESGGIDFSPDGQWIVFCSTAYYLYKIKIDNTELTQLTTFYADDLDWSPDGSKIVFEYENDIYTINSDGTGLTNLTNDGYTYSDYHPKWSPDGTKILWERKCDLWVMNSDGSNKTQIANININLDITSFLWNKSGDKIAFSNIQNIYIVNPDGSGLQKVTNNLNPVSNAGFWGNNVCWSGDYQKIAYAPVFLDPPEVKLTIMNKDGSNKYDLVSSTYEWIGNISFAPHNTKLVYSKHYAGEEKIYTINVDGTGETYLADGETPVWSNDTTRIAYVYNDYLYIMNSDGSNKVQISSCDYNCYPNWSPDDTMIVYTYNDDIYIALSSPPYTITQLTTNGYTTEEKYPVFSPDGTKIAYVNSQGELWVINTDGTGANKLVDQVDDDVAIKWAGNDRIYYLKEGSSNIHSVYSIKPDGTDERKESNIYTDILCFDVSPAGEIIYGWLDIYKSGVTGIVSGKVTRADGYTGISGANVRFFISDTGALIREMVTNADGMYSVVLPTGVYTVVASVETGGGNSWKISYSTQTNVVVYEEQTTGNINFSFEYTGKAWHGVNWTEGGLFTSGMRNPKQPIINQPVTIYLGNCFQIENVTSAVLYYKKSTENVWLSTNFVFYSSGTEGQYLINNYWEATIPAQSSPITIQYYIKVVYSRHDLTFVYGDDTHSFTTINENIAQREPFSFTILGTGAISGKVMDKNNNGIEGITVYVWTYDPPHSVVATTTTNNAGEYSITALPEGKYRVGISGAWQRGYVDRHYNNKADKYSADPVIVETGKTTTNINFILPKTCKISGVVKDQFEYAFPGVTVEAVEKNWNCWARPRNPNTGDWELTTSTGYYEIVGLLPGKYKIRAWFGELEKGVKPVYYNGKKNWGQADEIELSEGESKTIDLTLERDVTPPQVLIKINNDAPSTNIRIATLTITATDDIAGVDSVRISNDNLNWTDWRPYSTTTINQIQQQVLLTEGVGEKTVYMQARDKAGNVSPSVSDTIELREEAITPPVNITAGTNDYWGGQQQATIDDKTNQVDFHILSLNNPPPIHYTITLGFEADDIVVILPNGKRISYKQKYQISDPIRWVYVFEIPSDDIKGNTQRREDQPWIGDLECTLEITKGTQKFTQQLGKITLIDPSGYVYNIINDELVIGATVTLYRFNIGSGEFEFADPNYVGMEPRINPQITDVNGRYGWDVEPGRYYVKVEAPWYESTISSIVIIPPAVTDLNIGLNPTDKTPPTGSIIIAEGDYVETPVVTLQIKVTDNESGIRCMRISEKSDFADASWEKFSSTRSFTFSTTEKGRKTVYAQVKDRNGNLFTTAAYTAFVASNLTKAYPYPNPFKPNSGLGHEKITFTELTPKVRIRIFNIAGELVYDTGEITTDGKFSWQAVNSNQEKLASGIYIYLITNGKDKNKLGKIAIIR